MSLAETPCFQEPLLQSPAASVRLGHTRRAQVECGLRPVEVWSIDHISGGRGSSEWLKRQDINAWLDFSVRKPSEERALWRVQGRIMISQGPQSSSA